MSADQPAGEWTAAGWRIVLAGAVASGAGVVLLFFSFSLFVLPIMRELDVSRGELGAIQALVVTGALGAPVIGWLADRYGARLVYIGCALAVAGIEIAMALTAHSLTALAVSIALVGFFGVGTTALTTTRPVCAHFVRHRGQALGVVVAGVSLTTFLAPPPLQAVMDVWGWRGAVVALALVTLAVGVPAVAILLPRHVRAPRAAATSGSKAAAREFLKTRQFWLLALSGVMIGLATSGFVSQLSPMIQEEGLSPATAALGLSLFAAGQFAGRLGGGALLDRFDPRRTAIGLLVVPGSGFALLLATDHALPAALAAAFLIGLLQGGELDIGAFFIARSFPLPRYSAIYGAMHGIGWIGNAAGVIGVGLLHDRFGSYAPAQAAALAALIIGAILLAGVRVPLQQVAAD